jgi:predicted DCC family thiol-disulfide oxidoreductase YuxK
MDLKELSFTNPIIFFDGVCNLCNASVGLIIRNDSKGVFRFATLQANLLEEYSLTRPTSNDNFDSVLLLENGRLFSHSTAALRIAKRLSFPYPLFYALMLFPRFFRDWVYLHIAKRRYNWFGKQEACMIPTPELRSRFL